MLRWGVASLARAERAALLALLDDVGPHAPTLCPGWTTHDLVAHLVVRERQPLSVPGQVLPALHGLSERLEARARPQAWESLLASLRSGPPAWSPLGSPVATLYDLTNLHEFFVHLEDVRRATDPTPRVLDRALEDALWARTRVLAPLFVRRAGVGVELVTAGRQTLTARRGASRVVVRGRPGELFLWLWGRGSAAEVTVEGEGLAGVRIGP